MEDKENGDRGKFRRRNQRQKKLKICKYIDSKPIKRHGRIYR